MMGLTKKASIRKLAIANRGEVAVRIIHACRELGIKTVLLHSEADVATRAWRMADEKICIGPAPTAESYLRIDRNVEAAVSAGADAVHPGFGFLSENADFAQACQDAGLIFVGPKPSTIRALGDKISAKKLIEKAKVPTVPGYMGDDQKLETLITEAERIGYPVIVKAAAGGGGRGMKVIRSRAEAIELIASAQREAQSAFGSPVVFLEKYLDRAKHIEFQVFGDHNGRCVHLFERECSVQRRHQKIIEEALSPSLSPGLRAEMAKAAVALAESAGYNGAGTVEFLVQDGKFYFLEMNTRLQVEHPVTEMVLGVDLVKAQILTAMGEFEIWKQDALVPRGHAIECRVYAEDPYNRGLPSTGELLGLRWPEGPGRRFEVGIEEGDAVTPFYDPMIAKIIVWDENRPRAIRKLRQVLNETVIFGVRANLPYLKAIIDHPEFVEGSMTTQFIQNHFPEGLAPQELSEAQREFAMKALPLLMSGSGGGPNESRAAVALTAEAALFAPWAGHWRIV
jgi:3-methylcrotonyl-CoA carboxylase alpha subunit